MELVPKLISGESHGLRAPGGAHLTYFVANNNKSPGLGPGAVPSALEASPHFILITVPGIAISPMLEMRKLGESLNNFPKSTQLFELSSNRLSNSSARLN